MEPIMLLPMLFSFIIPFIIVFVVNASIIALIVWVVLSYFKTHRERNQILKEISQKLDGTPSEIMGRDG